MCVIHNFGDTISGSGIVVVIINIYIFCMKILSSASKIVFIMLAVTACIAFMSGLLEAKDFMLLATGAFSFYFANKGDSSEPFAGK